MKSKFIIPCHQVACHNRNLYRALQDGRRARGYTHTHDNCLQHMSRLSTLNTSTTPNSRTQIHVSERFFVCNCVQHVAQRPGTNPAVQPSNVRTTASSRNFLLLGQAGLPTHSFAPQMRRVLYRLSKIPKKQIRFHTLSRNSTVKLTVTVILWRL